MTREEAAKEVEHTVECCKMYLPEDDPWILALNIAISALHAQQTPAKLDRSLWEGCVVCDRCGEGGLIELRCGGVKAKYCPFCCRPLTEEARAELERRINGGTTDR